MSVASLANLTENFESYSLGSFTTQTSQWVDPVGAASTWEIVNKDGNKCLKQSSLAPVANLLEYKGELFDSSAEGYTIMMRVFMPTNEGGYPTYSGWTYDGIPNLDNDGPTAYDPPYYYHHYSNRFYFAENGLIANGFGAAHSTPLHGVGGCVQDTWLYARQYRQGDNVTVWVSTTPITSTNPGTIMISGASPALVWGDGDSIYLLGVGPVYYDDIQFVHGDNFNPALCGDENHLPPIGDINRDCYVNMLDLSVIAQNWLTCTDPLPPCSYNP